MKSRMEKLKLIKTVLFSMSLVLAFMFFGNVALADDKIDVEYPVGNNLNSDDIFDVDNILPGWEETRTIRVNNRSETDAVNLYFTFKIKEGEKLAKKLELYVIRESDNSYRIGGQGDYWTLKKADDNGALYVDKLKIKQGKKYKIKIKFDKSAGKKYRGLKTNFDIDFRIEARIAEDETTETEAEILAGEGRVVTGNPPAEEVQGAMIEGANQEEEKNNDVEGQENQCQSLPKWIWLTSLAIFLGIFGYNTLRNYNHVRYGWKIELILALSGILFWWYFDKCREYQWFLYGLNIGGISLYSLFLYFLRKKIKLKI